MIKKGGQEIFVGYSEETKEYRICFDGREISLSRDVISKEPITHQQLQK